MIAFIMLTLFVLTVRSTLIYAAGFPRMTSVQGKARVVPVSLRQLLILLSQKTTIRAVKQGRKSQLDDFTCINSKYKAVFIVESLLPAIWRCGPGCTREANHSRRPPVYPESRFLLRERAQ